MRSPTSRHRSALQPYLDLLDRAYRRLVPHEPAYLDLLDRIHQHVRPRTYLEIGVFTGRSLTLSLPGARNLGIDPEPQLQLPVSSSTRVFAQTSDAFFAEQDVGQILAGDPLDLAFIDGLHHFDVALRDFMNIERLATPDTVVLVHDCYPIDEVTAAREPTTAIWSGDVWKLVVCLKEHRPDLEIAVVDVAPTGLGVIRHLDPSSTVLADRYDDLVATYLDLPYDHLADGRQPAALNRVDADWPTVLTLLPGAPRRAGSPIALASLLTRRTGRAGAAAVGRRARRLLRRTP